MEEEAAYYLRDFEAYFETWEQFLGEAVYGDVSRRSSLLDLAGKDLALRKDSRFYWHARGTTAVNIVRAMYKHEIEDIYEELPSDIVLLRATLPEDQNSYRDLTSELFEQNTDGIVKVIPNTSHMLHWDDPNSVVDEIRKNWSHSS